VQVSIVQEFRKVFEAESLLCDEFRTHIRSLSARQNTMGNVWKRHRSHTEPYTAPSETKSLDPCEMCTRSALCTPLL